MYAVVSANYPSRLDELKGQVSVNGAPWVTAGSTWALGYSMTAAGYIGKTDGALAPLGAITGGVAGGTAGYLYSRAWPVEAGAAALISSAGFMGTVSGIFIGSGLEADDPTGAAYLGGLGGEVLGYGLGIGLQKQYNGQARDSWEAMGIGLLSGTVVGSAAAFQRQRTDNPNPRTVTPEIGAGLAIGTAIGHVAAPRVDIGKMDMALIGVSSSYGLAFGSLVPPTGGFRQGLPTFGLSAGALMGYGLSGAIEPQPDVVIGAITGGAFGGFFGAGVAQVAAPYDFQATQGTALAGITAGMALGGYFSHVNPDPIDDRDVVMTTMTTSWAAWQTTGWSIYAGSNASQPGPVYIIPTAVGATNAAVSGELDIPVTHSSAALSLGLWGAYAGGASAQLTGADPLLFALVGSDVALVGGVVLMSPLVGAPPLVIGLADAGGVLGGSTAALGTSIAIDNSDTILIASLIGSGAGLAGGAVIGTIWHQSGTSRNIALRLPRVRVPGRWSIAPTQLPGRDEPVLGVRMAIDQW